MTAVDPLPSGVSEYVAKGNHDATPDEILRECAVDESHREQVEHYLAVTRYGIFNDREANDADDLAFHTVEWSDVAEWGDVVGRPGRVAVDGAPPPVLVILSRITSNSGNSGTVSLR